MPWVKLDDDFSDHRKIMAVGPLAAWMHVCALCYCARLLTDGFVPAAQVRKLADVDDATSLAALLVREGLWEAVENGYRIHDYLEYNPSKEEVEATRNVRAEAGRRGGLNSGKTREAKSKQFASTKVAPLVQQSTKQTRSKNEPRTRTQSPTQDPVPEPSTQGESVPAARRFAPPTPDEAEAEFLRHGYGGRRLGAKFVAHYSQSNWRLKGGNKMSDWPAAILTWVLNEKDRSQNGGTISKNGTSTATTMEDLVQAELAGIERRLGVDQSNAS